MNPLLFFSFVSKVSLAAPCCIFLFFFSSLLLVFSFVNFFFWKKKRLYFSSLFVSLSFLLFRASLWLIVLAHEFYSIAHFLIVFGELSCILFPWRWEILGILVFHEVNGSVPLSLFLCLSFPGSLNAPYVAQTRWSPFLFTFFALFLLDHLMILVECLFDFFFFISYCPCNSVCA